LAFDHIFTGESDGEVSTSVSSPDSSQVLDSGGKPEQDPEAPVLPPKPGNLDERKSEIWKLHMLILNCYKESSSGKLWLALRLLQILIKFY
jgi:hypothetical protein